MRTTRSPRSPRSPLPLLPLLPLLLLVGLLTTWGATGPAAAAPPTGEGGTAVTSGPSAKERSAASQDFPNLPPGCATREEKIPASPKICRLNKFDKKRATVFLWGDSHAWMFIPALRRAMQGHDVNLVASLMGSCPPMDTNLKPGASVPACLKSNDLALRYVMRLHRRKPALRVVLGASWQRYLHALRVHDRESYVGELAVPFRKGGPRLFRTLGRAHIGTDVIGQVATVPEQHPRCRQGDDPYVCDLAATQALPERTSTRRWLANHTGPLPGSLAALDVNPTFCGQGVCHGLVDDVHTWFDDFHLSATRSRSLHAFFDLTMNRVDPVDDGGEDPGNPGCSLLIFC